MQADESRAPTDGPDHAAVPPDALFAPPRRGVRPEDCAFYHTMEIPGVGLVEGPWDLRGREDEYLGHVGFADQRVLEIGPASGFFTVLFEAAGASVVAVDTAPDAPWDLVPHALVDLKAAAAQRHELMERIRNSWWLVHERFGLRARVHYGHGAHLPDELGSFDVSILAAVLLHCRNPLDVLEAAASRSRTVVVTDLAYPSLSGPVCQLLPTAANQMVETWWALTPELIAQYLEVLGFSTAAVTHHSQAMNGTPTPFFTVVAHR